MRLLERIDVRHRLDLVLIASATLPATVVASSPGRAGMGAVFSTAAVAFPRVRRDWRFWALLAWVYGVWYWLDWTALDNHAWLMPVWFAGVAVGLRLSATGSELGPQARALVAGVFTFAVGWKLRSPDFLSGNFFEFTILTDPRFGPLATAAGVDPEILIANQMTVAAGPESGYLVGGSVVRPFANVLTVGTIITETAVAAAWLMGRLVPNWTRHFTLGAFCLATYTIAPVAGFGLILLAMGAAATETVAGARRYLVGMAAVFVWSAVWNAIVL